MNAERLNILVVDDSRVVRMVLVDELKTLGYGVHEAGSTTEADEVLKKIDIDILFLDLRLPQVTGLEYLEKLNEENKDVIVVIMTAHESPETAVEAIEKGAYDYVIKPIEIHQVELIIKRALKRYQIESEKRIHMEKRVKALELYQDTSNELRVEIDGLKKEVNDLLLGQGKSSKYKIL